MDYFQPRPRYMEKPKNEPAALRKMLNPVRKIVSQNRRRFHADEFDLDLTYITDRIIAMGYPADKTEYFYRNSLQQTVNFLETRHADHYKVFNLRGQYVYDIAKFKGRVRSFEMKDHHPPRLELMAPICREMHEYLEADPLNIVAVHCKAGKGRTGVMICAYLVYISFYNSPRQNMDYYSIIRTKNNKGVTIPSQRRYVYYFSHLRKHHLNYMPLRVELVGIFLEKPSRCRKNWRVRVFNGDIPVFNGEQFSISRRICSVEDAAWSDNKIAGTSRDCISPRAFGWQVPEAKRVFLEGDIRIELHNSTGSVVSDLLNSSSEMKFGHCWFNTMFVCPGYCSEEYMHGDEAHPYPDGRTILEADKAAVEATNESAPDSATDSTPSTSREGENTKKTTQAPSHDDSSNKKKRGMLNIFGKRTDGKSAQTSSEGGASSNRSANNTAAINSFKPLNPPGREKHCKLEDAILIFPAPDNTPPGTELPRNSSELWLKTAHEKNLVKDVYNERLREVATGGDAVEEAEEGRPYASGPNKIVRKSVEHVQVFPLVEIDEAVKRERGEMDPGFKVNIKRMREQVSQMYVVTRCVLRCDDGKAEDFLKITRERQAEKDKKRADKVKERERKLGTASSADKLANETCADSSTEDGDVRRGIDHLRKCPLREEEGLLTSAAIITSNAQDGSASDEANGKNAAVQEYHPGNEPDRSGSETEEPEQEQEEPDGLLD